MAGTATITVTTADGGKTAACSVTVTGGGATTVAVTGVTLNKTTLSLGVGGTETLTATIAPANATNTAVTWSTSDAAVATVTNGVVTAVATGTAAIIISTADGGKTATCSVTVTPATAPALNGKWVNDDSGSTFIFNNGNYEFPYLSGNNHYKGTFTTSVSTLTIILTHIWGEVVGLDEKWYSKAEYKEAMDMSDDSVDSYFQERSGTATYSISGNSLTLSSDAGAWGEDITGTYIKQ